MKIPSEVLQKRIVDAIRYRFYDRLDLYDVYRWLDNFNDDEQELAIIERRTYSTFCAKDCITSMKIFGMRKEKMHISGLCH